MAIETLSTDFAINHIANMVNKGVKFADLKHPEYMENEYNWRKWRLTYESDDDFITEYLKKFSKREADEDFLTRKSISYVPAFAKSAVNDVKDSIFQRIADVTRDGGSKSYQDAVKGLNGGIDLVGTTMNSFIGRILLPELLPMRKVGVFVDMPVLPGVTLREQKDFHPYIYEYKAENILNWTEQDGKFTTLLLKDDILDHDESTNLPKGLITRYRYFFVIDKMVFVQFFNEDSLPIDRFGNTGIDIQTIGLPEIPFVLFEISDSLLREIANYQIALLNLASSDISYSLKSNFPFYTEQFDPRVDNLYTRPVGHEKGTTPSLIQPGERDDTLAAKNHEIEVGTMAGRRVPKGLEMPRYIHPSSEPLKASMAKQEELKKDIRMLIKLTVANLTPKMASAESKSFDERSLEAGLSAIGLELEHGERNIAKFWQMYENPKDRAPTVKYPQKYSLQSDKDQREEAGNLIKSVDSNPSLLYKREALKLAVTKLIGSRVSQEKLEQIFSEIDSSKVIADPEHLMRDIELGLIDLEAASKAKAYPEGSVEKAAADHAERVKRIAESQAKARGNTDMAGLANVSREEKMNKDTDAVAEEKTRASAT